MGIAKLENPFDMAVIREICCKASSDILARYFHSQGILLEVDFSDLGKQQNKDGQSSLIMKLLADLDKDQQAMVLEDFRVVNFYLQSIAQGEKNR